MALIKNLFTMLYSRIDHVANQMENHDAVIEVAIKDTRRALARAKVHLARVQADGQKLTTQKNKMIAAEYKWKQRAKDMARENEITAMACISRRRECQQQIQTLASALSRHEEVEKRLVADINKLEQRLSMISRQSNLMRARQSTAQALNVIQNTQHMDCHEEQDIDDLFDRWEIKISESEIATGQSEPLDSLERKFQDEEEKKDLRTELEKIITDQGE
ncbi:phage shock protein A (PspA) family protein [Nitrosomonas cryotolerans]|uniref:Phage shock protein A (PspA) family protein n=1 Tax=Nitrosomonas cryotolerans ATCC 49181 TaxID=1131553 RepID=A0A1N6ISX9_9PROT|nr:PspA/IM30 family protein [Nitrosomonas cryotolerans]SFP33066.1 phage shock protein A (PspA) family protein [Nitrosomonas cryotolerans]SIO35106.1 phage shock protein A (PspA) family protein [Nitrosomonas cryotolerans ATCC 49181]